MTFHDEHISKLDSEMAERVLQDIKRKVETYIKASESDKVLHLEAQIKKLEKQIENLKAPQTEKLFDD